jgi:NTE family protein
MKNNKNVALVLSGGAARGIAHIGVIEELIKQGYYIHSIAGTSMGALVGGVYALGKLEAFKTWIISLDKIEIIKLLDFTLTSPGLIKGNRVLDKIKSFIPEKNIESLDVSYKAIATNINKNTTHIFESGDIYEAIRASISIPAIFTPVEKDSLILVDGGLVNNIPINHVDRIDADILIACHVNANIPYRIQKKKGNKNFQSKHFELQEHIKKHFKKKKKEKMGYFDLIYKSMFLPVGKISSLMLEQYPPDVLVEISHDTCGLFDFLQAEKLIEIGRKTTRDQLELFNKKKK